MADNFVANPGTGGDTFAADDVSGVKYPISKLDIGADGVSSPVTAANPLPVELTDGTNPVVIKPLSAVPVATDAALMTQAIIHGRTTAGGGAFVDVKVNPSGALAADVSDSTNVGTIPTGAGAAFWPSYKGVADTSQQGFNVDTGGALITRGAVTTDEGTFRVNFANTSLAVSIGSVTVSGKTVTGSGFLAADVNYHDYFKLDADAESAWSQIDYVVDDTTIMLTNAYTGGASGAASRALVVPITQTGGGYSVASGQLTITSGTTSGGGVIIGRIMDYGPLVFRARLSISQRVANNETRIGFAEPVTVTQPRWTARFIADGTVNTTIKCESSRNPTTAPSAAETETTVITIPNGGNTSQQLDYRIEQLTESVRFYISGVLVAEHSKVMPAQSDLMVASVRSFNPAVPASSTTVVVDFMTVKNHNKLEIGVMSNTEQIVAAAAPLQQFTYSVAGVIPINTDLIAMDCSQLRSIYIQCNSMGTTGVVTVQWSNEPTFAQPITATLIGESGATSTTFNAAAMRVTNVIARYCRLRLTTATTAGTTTLNVWGAQTTYTPIVATQPVSGTVTANVAGQAAHDAVISGNPVRVSGRAMTANYTAVASGDVADLVTTTTGALLVKPFALHELQRTYAAASGGLTTNTSTQAIAAPGAGLRNYVTGFSIQNASATIPTEFVIMSNATVLWRGYLGTGALLNSAVGVQTVIPLQAAVNEAINIQCITTGAQVYANLQGYVAP